VEDKMYEFSLTAIPCEMNGNSLDTMLDIVVQYSMNIVTYKVCTSARIPVRQVCIESGCFKEHVTLLSFGIKVERRNA
jgi:hypothetical protein